MPTFFVCTIAPGFSILSSMACGSKCKNSSSISALAKVSRSANWVSSANSSINSTTFA